MIKDDMKDLIENFEVIITQDFVDYRDGEYNKRTYNQHKPNMNSLALEYYLLKDKKVQPPSHVWRNDFIFDDKKIDVKRIFSEYFNLESSKKVQQLLESEQIKQLDYLTFYKQLAYRNGQFFNDNYDMLMPGDTLNFKFIGIHTPTRALRNVQPSVKKKDGYYVRTSYLR